MYRKIFVTRIKLVSLIIITTKKLFVRVKMTHIADNIYRRESNHILKMTNTPITQSFFES